MNLASVLAKTSQTKIFAVSGGPDSMYLLDFFVKKYPKMKIVVGHVNYNFRVNSGFDQKIVEHYCKKHNLKLEVKTVDPKIYQNFQDNFEEYARIFRYNFFKTLTKKYQTNIVVLGHNQNDLIETYLMQKQRQNFVNYYGLKEVSEYQNFLIYRPLLKIKKSEILKENQKNQLSFAIDETNFDQRYKRNKIRANLQEKDFGKYLKEIKILNETKKLQLNFAKNYLKINLQASRLLINQKFKTQSLDNQKAIIIAFFQEIKQENLLLKRSKNLIQEIIKMLLNEQKPFVKIKLQEQFIVKDFDELYVVNENFFETFSLKLTSLKDLENLKNQKLKIAVKSLINTEKVPFLYLLTNDFEDYKTWALVGNKKANRYFINQKIKYRVRYQNPALIEIENKQILNIKVF